MIVARRFIEVMVTAGMLVAARVSRAGEEDVPGRPDALQDGFETAGAELAARVHGRDGRLAGPGPVAAGRPWRPTLANIFSSKPRAATSSS